MSRLWVSAATRERILQGDVPLWILRHRRRTYIMTAILATPAWVDRKAMSRMRAGRPANHVLDHIVPLSHPMVCGLNVPWNLQLIPSGVNARKSNRFLPDQMELQL